MGLAATRVPFVLRNKVCAGIACKMAQSKAQRVAFRTRRSVLDHDTWLDDALAFAGKDKNR